MTAALLLPQHHRCFFDGGDESFYFLLGVVNREGGAGGAGDAEALHEWLATMVAGADTDSHLIHQCAEVKVVDAFDTEGEY